MTTWLDWRTEPLSDVPEIEIRQLSEGSAFDVLCNHQVCEKHIVDWSFDKSEAEDMKLQHMKWHEDGMPQ